MECRHFPRCLDWPPNVPSAQASNGTRRVVAIPLILLALLTACIAQAADAPPSWKTGNLDPQEAWADLERSTMALVHSASDPAVLQTRAGQVLEDLVQFAKLYSGSEQATLALFSHGALAAGIGDVEAADKSLQQALKQAKDPMMLAAINYQIAKISVLPGATHRPISGKSIDAGKPISTTQFKGKVLLLDFWATWCGPCLAELPQLKKIYKELHDQGFEILSISLDDDEQAARQYIKRENLNWGHLLNATMPPGHDAAGLYAVEAIPHTVLIGRDGRIVSLGLLGAQLEIAIRSELTKPIKPEAVVPRVIDRPAQAALDQIAPALAIGEWARGKPTSLDALMGKVVMIDIFQIICPGCHIAHPKIVQMMDRYKDQGLEVLGLAVAFEHQSAQTSEHIRRFVDKKAYPYPVAIDKQLTQTFRRYGAAGSPFTVLIDRAGRIRYLDFFRQGQIEPLVKQLLSEEG